MKTNRLLILMVLFTVQLTSAQVLWSDNFDNLTLGNVGTDDTGVTPGQGGWYTTSTTHSIPYVGNNDFNIITEPGRGKVLEVIGPAVQSSWGSSSKIEQKGLELLWDNRAVGNDVLKIEYDFFTGNVASSYRGVTFSNVLNFNDSNLIEMHYNDHLNLFYVNCSICTQPFSWGRILSSTVPTNTWLKLELYLDYVNEISYFTIPSLGISGVSGWFSSLNFSGMELYVGSAAGASLQVIHKFDNFQVSAVNKVPLSVQDFISNKFNVFPNPASNVVTINNAENITIEQVEVFDISGKTVKTQQFNNENQVQLNIEELASGSYLLHIKTNEGTAMKKLVKK